MNALVSMSAPAGARVTGAGAAEAMEARAKVERAMVESISRKMEKTGLGDGKVG